MSCWIEISGFEFVEVDSPSTPSIFRKNELFDRIDVRYVAGEIWYLASVGKLAGGTGTE